jgi:hypothetical protein
VLFGDLDRDLPQQLDTLSKETPLRSSETANVSRNRWGWQFRTGGSPLALLEHTFDHALRLARAVAEEAACVRVLDRIQLLDDVVRKWTGHPSNARRIGKRFDLRSGYGISVV